jgi:beta-glucuronidase
MLREQLDLSGLWRFQPDPANEGELINYTLPTYDDGRWREVMLPACFDTLYSNLDCYEGVGWYRRTIHAPAAWRDRRVVLQFEGVNYHAAVWLNGQSLGEHRDGFLPFAFDVTDVLDFAGPNVLVVRSDNTRLAGEVPGRERGWRPFGGIQREIRLLATDLVYLDHVGITAESNGSLQLTVAAQNTRQEPTNVEIVAHIADSAGARVATLHVDATVGQNTVETVVLSDTVANAALWQPGAPVLYTAEVELRAGEQIVDAQTVRFGFRTVRTDGTRLLVNDQPIYLTGFNRHEDSPQRDMAPDPELARSDLLAMMEAGANFVRLCHYPHHRATLDLCDELGILAMEEIPLYWWSGYQEGEAEHTQKVEAAKRQLRGLVRRDSNHPSIIFWCVSNETHEQHPEVAEGNQDLVRFTKQLDHSRLVVHVSDHWQQYPSFEHDDVICVNAYPSFNQRGLGGKHDYDLAESTRFWHDGLATLHQHYPDKPILISEFGYGSFEGMFGGSFGEDTQADILQAEFDGMDAPYVCGATIWCWADHAWPPTTFAYCRNLAISPYGVVTRERRRLHSYWTTQRMFRERQGIREPERSAQPQPTEAGYAVAMVRPNLANLPEIPFPNGFTIRPLQPDEGALWTDIQRDAEPFFPIGNNLFQQEFGKDLAALTWRSYLVTTDRGVGVGVISAWYNRAYHGQDYGQIHWVAIRPAYQGRGLAKAMLSYALRQMSQWHERAMLFTQTRRLPAIRLYLDAGFVPDVTSPGAEIGWRDVAAELSHPSLERLSTSG